MFFAVVKVIQSRYTFIHYVINILAQFINLPVSHVLGGVVALMALPKLFAQFCEGLLHIRGGIPQLLWVALGSLGHIPTENLDALFLRVCQTLIVKRCIMLIFSSLCT